MGSKRDAGTESFGALLRIYRGRMSLTQEELAERAGLHGQTISQLELGVIRRPRSTTVQFLADALKLDAQERATFVAASQGRLAPLAHSLAGGSEQVLPSAVDLADAESIFASIPTDAVPPPGALPAGSRMPLAPNPLFVGRDDELLQVGRALLASASTLALGQVVASTGLGGLGKTQLAVEFVHRYGRFFGGGVFWLSFASADEIPLQVAACAAPELESRSVEERVRMVTATWQNATPRLLVFDNCEEESLLEAWRPTSGGCRVLVTSRRSTWMPTLGVTALPLDLLPRADSIALLRRYRPELAQDNSALDALAVELGDLPLALHLAGSYLRAYPAEVTLDDYLTELRRESVVQHASLVGAGLDDSPSPTHHVQSVAATFALCLGRLVREREVDRVAIALLARMARMAPGKPVSRDLLAKTMEDVDPRLRADGLRRLGTLGLVGEVDGWLRLHRLLVHFVRQEGLDPDAQPAVARALVSCGKDAEQGHLTGQALAGVIPHLVDVAGAVVGDPADERRVAELYIAAGQALRYAGDFRAARPWYERAVAIRECGLGPDHPDTGESLSDLGGLLYDQGDLSAARPLFERALAIRQGTLARDHPEVGKDCNNLGILLWAQGQLADARALLERALAIWESVAAGADYPEIAWVLNNLGHLLRDQGDLDTAKATFERALALRERMLGPEHPHTAHSLNGLAGLLRDKGELGAARPLFERCLRIRELGLGPDHPDTALSLHNLALLLRDQGNPAAARPLFERALAIRERVLGPDHPDTVATRRALAELAAEGAGRKRPPVTGTRLLDRKLTVS